MSELSHVNKDGKTKMVDITGKADTARYATVSAKVLLNLKTFQLIKDNQIGKGDVLNVAKLAGIQAAKKTAELIPLCHPLPLTHIDIDFTLNDKKHTILITATCKTKAPTGVEMEAFIACSISAVTIYDMVKAVQKDVVITDIMLLEKSGGKSGEFRR